MKKTYTIQFDEGITCVRFHRRPTYDDLETVIDDLVQNHDLRFRLWDFSCGFDLTNAQVELLADRTKSSFKVQSRVALIAPDDLSYGVARMYDVHRKDGRVVQKTFRTEEEARDWLKSASQEAGDA